MRWKKAGFAKGGIVCCIAVTAASRGTNFNSVLKQQNTDLCINIPCSVNQGIGNGFSKCFLRNLLYLYPIHSQNFFILLIIAIDQNRFLQFRKYGLLFLHVLE